MDRATEQVRLCATLQGSSRVKYGCLLSTEHPEKLLSRALSAKKEWGLRIYVKAKIAVYFCYESGGQESESRRARHPGTLARHNEALRPVLRHVPAPSLVFGRSSSRRASPWLNELGHGTSLPITGAGTTRGGEGEPNNRLGFRQIGPAPSFRA
jgi:hypothetical protein